jgi:hypothetical protein
VGAVEASCLDRRQQQIHAVVNVGGEGAGRLAESFLEMENELIPCRVVGRWVVRIGGDETFGRRGRG